MLYILGYADWFFSLERSEGCVGFQKEHVLVRGTFQESSGQVPYTSGWREVNTVFIHGPHDICGATGREWGWRQGRQV